MSSGSQEEQVVAWHEWLCQDCAAAAARCGGVVLERELISKAQDYARHGIPAAYRRTVYGLLSHPVSPGVYASYCAKADSWSDNEILNQIDRDINRTFTLHPAFMPTAQGVQSLRSVLRAVAMRFPYIGYCQGMNFVAGLLLVVTKSGASHDFSTQVQAVSLEETREIEESAFWIVCGLVDSLLPEAYFGSDRHNKLPQLHGLRNSLEVVTFLMESRTPGLVAHLKDLGLPPSVFAVRWLPCLFSGCLPAETCLRIWDLLFAFGECVLYQAAVALMEMHAEQLMDTDDPQQAFDIIQNASASMYDADQLLQHLDLSINERHLERVQQSLSQQEVPCAASSASSADSSEQPGPSDSALQVVSGLFEDLGASWIVVEAVFKDSAVTDVVTSMHFGKRCLENGAKAET
eukprot:TRINITY_DN1140_c0_g4_i3.p1 TRINITY_DN1140_c0_g4~~TRINITY_DN1140_c0_g4_i3.p1  ORF type:complete len:405 (-),score=100.35 TRINITY_DN1140_c0_g4_i3:451-1665(-)